MIKFENNNVSFAAIHAWVTTKIFFEKVPYRNLIIVIVLSCPRLICLFILHVVPSRICAPGFWIVTTCDWLVHFHHFSTPHEFRWRGAYRNRLNPPNQQPEEKRRWMKWQGTATNEPQPSQLCCLADSYARFSGCTQLQHDRASVASRTEQCGATA